MNEFLEQFLIECRELIDQGTDDLLALEERPGEGERLDGAFRAFHTLKGAAGIMDFDAMARALHAAEDILAAARAGDEPVTPGLIGDCLTCLDQVVQWLDVMEATGDLPAGADAAADAVAARFVRSPSATAAAPPPRAEPEEDWAAMLQARHAEVTGARTAFDWRPDADSFFRGLDPLVVVASLPGLLALEIDGAEGWPPLEEMDPFACRLVLRGLADGAPAAITATLEGHGGELAVRPVGEVGGLRSAPVSPAEDLLRAQVSMLASAEDEGLAGRIGSAARVAANVLRASGREDEAQRMERLWRASPATDPEAVIEAIRQAIDGELSEAQDSDAGARVAPEPAARTLRVDVERVDALVDLTGELTVAKNALGYAAAAARAGEAPEALADMLKAQHAQLDRLIAELQRSVLGIRVLPLRHVFQRFPRLVRELVVALGKPARLVTEGDGTEADKAIVESLFEPLLHLLRNALDHGVETVEERAGVGKPPSATIQLRARRDGDHVLIEVEDDGRGIDVGKVRAVAQQRGVATAEALAAMSDEEAAGLIFAPGFSTAAEVTKVSGRGVGMDAVRTAIERLGGRVSVESQLGVGAVVRLTLPFTVVMTRVMTVEAAGQLFGIPMEGVLETVRLPRRDIVRVGAAQAFVLRDRTFPLIDLAEALGREGGDRDGEFANVVVAAAGGHAGGLEVDRLGDRLDVMLKPLEGLLAGTSGVAGTTLMGDGRVLLVLNLQEVLQ